MYLPRFKAKGEEHQGHLGMLGFAKRAELVRKNYK